MDGERPRAAVHPLGGKTLLRFRRARRSWWWIPITVFFEALAFGWLAFFVPWWVTGMALTAFAITLGAAAFAWFSPGARLTEQGIAVFPARVVPWTKVRAFEFSGGGLSLIVESEQLYATEWVINLECPLDQWPRALEILQRYAPKARHLGT
jgi:hypothetical protein